MASLTLSEAVMDAIVSADCYCKPGDPTCGDWTSETHRWETIHRAVMNAINHFNNTAVIIRGQDNQPQMELFDLTSESVPVEEVPHYLDSPLVAHARRELELIGENPEWVEGYLNVIREFAAMGHSGGSASVAIPVINELLQFKNLKPLTDNPDEWMHVAASDYGTPHDIWQNRRNPEAFSNDGGKTYYLLSEGGSDKNRRPTHTSEVWNGS